jgi:Protein of unknown function (DUF1203)
MNELSVHSLLVTEILFVSDVACNGGCNHKSGEECTHATNMVFPYRGVYLRHVGKQDILAYRPFPALQPYAETGPVFLHAAPCARADEAHTAPPQLARRAAHLIKGYGGNDRIVYGTGKIVPSGDLDAEAAAILKRDDVAYVHVRSSVNNCYTCRIERG